MALSATTVFDIVDQTQSITFNNPTMVDQISFANNQLTFAEISTFTLTQSDMLLYVKYLQAFYTLLVQNFPTINIAFTQPWPLCLFSLAETDVGINKITYTQTSNGANVYTINYLPEELSAGFLARTAPAVITTQEFLWTIPMMNQFGNQIAIY
jgi:hypothetical protein